MSTTDSVGFAAKTKPGRTICETIAKSDKVAILRRRDAKIRIFSVNGLGDTILTLHIWHILSNVVSRLCSNILYRFFIKKYPIKLDIDF